MPVNCYEHAESGGLKVTTTGVSLPTRWNVTGTTSRVEAYEAVLAATPLSFGGLVRGEVSLDEKGGGVWLADVMYSNVDANRAVGGNPQTPTAPSDNQPLMPTPGQGTGEQGQPFLFNFDTSAQQVHITQSWETVIKQPKPGTTAPDFKQAIAVDNEHVNGCDVYAPKFEFGIKVERATVTLAYAKTLRDLAGRTNEDDWWGFAAGTVLYLGATGEYTQGGRWSVAHKFLGGKTDKNITIGNGIVVANKLPHEFLWCGYGPDTSNGRHVQVPIAAYVERVYLTGDFSQLEIGE